jgi:acetyl esterase/lipase
MLTKRRDIIAAFLLLIAASLILPPHADAQLSGTRAFLADIANQYRIVPNVVYHEANNHENTLDLYLPTNASGPTPVLLMIHGGGWVAGTKEGQSLRLLPYLEMGWAVVNVSYRLVQVSRAPAAVEDCLCTAQLQRPNCDPRSSGSGHHQLVWHYRCRRPHTREEHQRLRRRMDGESY